MDQWNSSSSLFNFPVSSVFCLLNFSIDKRIMGNCVSQMLQCCGLKKDESSQVRVSICSQSVICLKILKYIPLLVWRIGWPCSVDWFRWWLPWKQCTNYLVSYSRFVAKQKLLLNFELSYVFSAKHITPYFQKNLKNSQTWIKFYKIWQRKCSVCFSNWIIFCIW